MFRADRHRPWALLLTLAVAACGGRGAASRDGGAGVGAGGSGGGGGGGTIGTNGGDAASGATGADGGGDASSESPVPGADPGRVSMRRLTKIEYDNTVKDLLGVNASPAPSFIADERVSGFDNLAEGLHMSPDRYLQYLEAAGALADAVWSDAALKGRIVTCAPDTTGQCARAVIKAFGFRAWRRPLTDAEVDSLGKFADAALAETADFQLAMKRVVTVMLSSLPFLYKIETDPEPTSAAPHPLTGYELASRLSYLLWSSMPDATLFDLGDSLRQPDVLSAQLDRMLVHPRSDAFVESFAGQWLGVRDLASHGVSPGAFPDWDEALSQAMAKEMYLYVVDFFDRPMAEFLTADLHFVDARLGRHYGFASALGADLVRVTAPTAHKGFLGLAGFLTLTSHEDRTSPSQRGSWILDHLLCAPPAGHPAGIMPRLDIGASPVNLRKVVEQTLLQVSCKECHATFDGVGYGLEHFDGIGSFRANYTPTEPIDATGTLPGGAKFDGAIQLGAALAADPRVPACAASKALSYSLGRVLDDADQGRVASIAAAWKHGTLRELLHAIVASDAFRLRRGELP